jgi:hypothetical protein
MIIDIYKSYFKNQGIKLTSRMQGMDNIDSFVVERIERHARLSVKDLLQLMQIDPSFIPKVCNFLT